MGCKPTYKGVRYNSLEELYNANGVNEQQKQKAQQLYSQYLDTIFPDSKVKDVVYHGSSKFGFDKFSKEKLGEFTGSSSAKLGFFFSNSLENSFAAYTANVGKDVSFGDDGLIEDVEGTFSLGKLDSVIEDLENNGSFTDNEIRYKEFYVKSINPSGGASIGIPFKTKQEALDDYKNDDWNYDSKNTIEVIEDVKYGKYSYKKVDWLKNKPVIYYKKDLESNKEVSISEQEYNKALNKRKNFLLLERERLINKESKNRVYNILLNSKDLKEFDDKGNQWREETYVDRIKQTLSENKDGLVIRNTYDPLLNDVYVVFEPEQIHILSSKADIQGFKEFVDNNQSDEQVVSEKSIIFAKLDEPIKKILLKRGFTESSWDNLSTKVKEHEINCLK